MVLPAFQIYLVFAPFENRETPFDVQKEHAGMRWLDWTLVIGIEKH